MLQWTKKNFRLTTKTAIIAGMFLIAVFAFLVAIPAYAADVQTDSIAAPSSSLNTGVQIIQQPLGLSATDPRAIVANIIRVALGLLGIIVLILMIYAGFLWMTSAGNDEQIGKAKQILKNATIGLAIILLAYAIVAFIFNMLGLGGGPVAGNVIIPTITQNFRGSGSLGKVIKDHYPMRGQTKVPRNTKIIISFFSPVKIDSFAVTSTSGAAPGTCNNLGAGMSWERDCSQMRSSSNEISIYRLVVNPADGQIVRGDRIRGAALVASTSTVGGLVGYYTIVIRPYDFLGSPTEEVGYEVHLGNELKKDDSANDDPSIFEVQISGNDYYEWRFTCSTELDLTPPYVKNVYPGRGAKETKDTVMQIEFSEPMDPSGVQGVFSTDGTYGPNTYVLDGRNVFMTSDNSSRPIGEMNLTNGFTTLEFTPTVKCGTNACGEPKFCFPVCDGAGQCQNVARNGRGEQIVGDSFETFLRAGVALNTDSFEAIPFSGVMDAAGNALDGKHDGLVQIATNSSTVPVFHDWEDPDNYWWSFILKNELDTVSPYLNEIYPTFKAANVPSWAPWGFVFSKRMRIDPMYYILIDEEPTPAIRGDGIPLWKLPRVTFGDINTVTEMLHGPFLDGFKQDYYPIATSAIQDAHFNCFYPGAGPGTGVGNTDPPVVNFAAGADRSLLCDSANPVNCCAVTSSAAGTYDQDYCCNGSVKAGVTTTAACVQYFRTYLPNPYHSNP